VLLSIIETVGRVAETRQQQAFCDTFVRTMPLRNARRIAVTVTTSTSWRQQQVDANGQTDG
jgi:hypothetical protein